MPKLVIYGHSDDLIVVGGDFSDEFSPSDPEGGFAILVSDGTVVTGSYDFQGMWRLNVTSLSDTSSYVKDEGKHPDTDYSDVIALEGPNVKWVGVTTYLSKAT